MRSGSLDTQLNKSDIACNVQALSAGAYEGAWSLFSFVCLSQVIPNLGKTNYMSNTVKPANTDIERGIESVCINAGVSV